MNLSNKKLLISLLITIITGAIFWKIAKDEIFYLCSNFSAGVTKSIVIRQLNTANLSSYMNTSNDSGSTIVFSSKVYFVSNQCVIKLDESEKVIHASFM